MELAPKGRKKYPRWGVHSRLGHKRRCQRALTDGTLLFMSTPHGSASDFKEAGPVVPTRQTPRRVASVVVIDGNRNPRVAPPVIPLKLSRRKVIVPRICHAERSGIVRRTTPRSRSIPSSGDSSDSPLDHMIRANLSPRRVSFLAALDNHRQTE
jgi:hypothetical protein